MCFSLLPSSFLLGRIVSVHSLETGCRFHSSCGKVCQEPTMSHFNQPSMPRFYSFSISVFHEPYLFILWLIVHVNFFLEKSVINYHGRNYGLTFHKDFKSIQDIVWVSLCIYKDKLHFSFSISLESFSLCTPALSS